MSDKCYYHITRLENIESILHDGLKANSDGEIFLFENESLIYPDCTESGAIWKQSYIADLIASNQLFLTKYAMFEILPGGIEVDLINDNVAELSAKAQWIAKQPLIKPEYIRLFLINKKIGKPKIFNGDFNTLKRKFDTKHKGGEDEREQRGHTKTER